MKLLYWEMLIIPLTRYILLCSIFIRFLLEISIFMWIPQKSQVIFYGMISYIQIIKTGHLAKIDDKKWPTLKMFFVLVLSFLLIKDNFHKIWISTIMFWLISNFCTWKMKNEHSIALLSFWKVLVCLKFIIFLNESFSLQ